MVESRSVGRWPGRWPLWVAVVAGLWLPVTARGQTGFDWLGDALHPRGMALANAAVAAADPTEALGLNPAGLAGMPPRPGPQRRFLLGLRRDPAGISQQLTQFIFPAGTQTVGLEIRRLDYGTFPGYDSDGQRQTDYTAVDLLLRGGVMRRVGSYLAVGAAVGVLSGRLEQETARAVLWSLGIQLEVAPLDARLGAVLQNQGRFTTPFGNMLPDELPATWLVGFTKSLAHLPLTLHVSGGRNVAANRVLWRLGGELRLPWRLVLRLGVDQGKPDYRRGSVYADLLSGFSLGFGTRTGGPAATTVGADPRSVSLTLDGAVKFLGPLGFSSSFALELRF